VKPVVKVHCPAENTEQCQITIEDNGIGFEERHLTRALPPFRGCMAEAVKMRGRAWGLPSARKLSSATGGEHYRQNPAGCRFYLYSGVADFRRCREADLRFLKAHDFHRGKG
jgi:hypothetical protein